MHKEHAYTRFWLVLGLMALVPVIVELMDKGAPLDENRTHLYWLLGWLPYALLGVLTFLGARLNQNRIPFVTVSLALAYAFLRHDLTATQSAFPPHTIPFAASMALPLGIMTVLPMAEGRFFSGRTLMRIAAGILPWCAMLLPLTVSHDALIYVFHCPPPLSPYRLPLLTLPVAAASAVLILLLKDDQLRFFNRALVMGLLPLEFVLNQATVQSDTHLPPPAILAIGFTTLSGMLGYAVYRTFWEKAYIDDLTGLPNRRSLNERLGKMGSRYTLAMLDIDHFKSHNDTYGHTVGDHVLRFLASHLSRAFGTNVYRYGGEEFCVLFDGLGMRTAATMMDSFRRYLESKEFVVRRTDELRKSTSERDRGASVGRSLPHLRITLSAGLAYRNIPDEKPEDIIELADKALYAAKEQGRNRVLCYGPLE